MSEHTPLVWSHDQSRRELCSYGRYSLRHFLEKGGVYNGNPNDSWDLIVDLEQLRKRGATHVVFTSNTLWWLDYYKEFAQHLDQTATLIVANSQFKIFQLAPRAAR